MFRESVREVSGASLREVAHTGTRQLWTVINPPDYVETPPYVAVMAWSPLPTVGGNRHVAEILRAGFENDLRRVPTWMDYGSKVSKLERGLHTGFRGEPTESPFQILGFTGAPIALPVVLSARQAYHERALRKARMEGEWQTLRENRKTDSGA